MGNSLGRQPTCWENRRYRLRRQHLASWWPRPQHPLSEPGTRTPRTCSPTCTFVCPAGRQDTRTPCLRRERTFHSESRWCNRRGMPPAGTKARYAVWLSCGRWSPHSDLAATPASAPEPRVQQGIAVAQEQGKRPRAGGTDGGIFFDAAEIMPMTAHGYAVRSIPGAPQRSVPVTPSRSPARRLRP